MVSPPRAPAAAPLVILPMPRLALLLLACPLLLRSEPRLALRHDVDEARYLELGKAFPAVVQVGGLGSGVLVARDWVLTAAHVPEMIQRGSRGAPLRVTIGAKECEVKRVVVPPERALERELHDIALLQLADFAPEEVVPHSFWEEDVEPGAEFVLAGWGVLAQGDKGVEVTPESMAAPTRARRAGWNRVERFDPEKGLLIARFDAPGAGLELEAAPCLGDSGGPALLREGAGEAGPTWRVIGVIAHVEDTDADRIVGEYGDEFALTFVAGYADWIRATLGE